MVRAEFIDFVVKEEINVPDPPQPVIERQEFVGPKIDPCLISDSETARLVASRMHLIRKRYNLLHFVVDGENRYLYVNFDGAIAAGTVMKGLIDGFKKEIQEKEYAISLMRAEIRFFEGLLIVRCFMFFLNHWKEVKGWSLKLARKLSINLVKR